MSAGVSHVSTKLFPLCVWRNLPPKQQGYILYMQGDLPGSELKGMENPYLVGSIQYGQFQEGERAAVLAAQDSEE